MRQYLTRWGARCREISLVAVAGPGGTIGQAIGAVLPLAIGVDISVVPIIAIILMLITPRARSNGLAFVAGWVLGLVAVGGLVLVIANTAGVASSSGPSTAAYAIKLTLGVLFLLLR